MESQQELDLQTQKEVKKMFRKFAWNHYKEMLDVRPVGLQLAAILMAWVSYFVLSHANELFGADASFSFSPAAMETIHLGIAAMSVVSVVLMSLKSLLPGVLLWLAGTVLVLFSLVPLSVGFGILACSVVALYIHKIGYFFHFNGR